MIKFNQVRLILQEFYIYLYNLLYVEIFALIIIMYYFIRFEYKAYI